MRISQLYMYISAAKYDTRNIFYDYGCTSSREVRIILKLMAWLSHAHELLPMRVRIGTSWSPTCCAWLSVTTYLKLVLYHLSCCMAGLYGHHWTSWRSAGKPVPGAVRAVHHTYLLIMQEKVEKMSQLIWESLPCQDTATAEAIVGQEHLRSEIVGGRRDPFLLPTSTWKLLARGMVSIQFWGRLVRWHMYAIVDKPTQAAAYALSATTFSTVF